MLRYRVLDRLRQRGEGFESDDALATVADDGPGPEAQVETAQETRRLDRCLEHLPDDRRGAIFLAYFNGLSHGQIAQRLAHPLGTIKSRIRAGLRALQEVLVHMIEENDADRRVQIGEYVLGLLEGAERAEVHALIERDRAAASMALAWEDDFLALADRLPPQAPSSAAVWARIQSALGLALGQQPPLQAVRAAPRTGGLRGFWENLTAWRWLAARPGDGRSGAGGDAGRQSVGAAHARAHGGAAGLARTPGPVGS